MCKHTIHKCCGGDVCKATIRNEVLTMCVNIQYSNKVVIVKTLIYICLIDRCFFCSDMQD